MRANQNSKVSVSLLEEKVAPTQSPIQKAIGDKSALLRSLSETENLDLKDLLAVRTVDRRVTINANPIQREVLIVLNRELRASTSVVTRMVQNQSSDRANPSALTLSLANPDPTLNLVNPDLTLNPVNLDDRTPGPISLNLTLDLANPDVQTADRVSQDV